MKILSVKTLLALITLVSLQAKANSPVPAIDPIDPSFQPVLQLSVGGGMPAPGGLSSKIITLTRTGVVRVHERYYQVQFTPGSPQGVQKDYVLTEATQLDMLNIGEALGRLKGGKLQQSSQPECADAPGYVYDAFKGMTKITVFEIINCQEKQLTDVSQREDAKTIKGYLDQLLALSASHQP